LAGPAFGFSSNVALELEYDDFEKLREHPMAAQLLMTLDELTTGILDKRAAEIKDYKENMGDDFDKAKFDEYVNSPQGEYVK